MSSNQNPSDRRCACNPCHAASCECSAKGVAKPAGPARCCCGDRCGCGERCECPPSCGCAG